MTNSNVGKFKVHWKYALFTYYEFLVLCFKYQKFETTFVHQSFSNTLEDMFSILYFRNKSDGCCKADTFKTKLKVFVLSKRFRFRLQFVVFNAKANVYVFLRLLIILYNLISRDRGHT